MKEFHKVVKVYFPLQEANEGLTAKRREGERGRGGGCVRALP